MGGRRNRTFFEGFKVNVDIRNYNSKLDTTDKEICDRLAEEINNALGSEESKIWHAHPVWFIEGNPIVGYSKQKKGIRLMFWSGADFEESELVYKQGKFKDASIFYNSVDEINSTDLGRWLEKSKEIQWDYKNIVKRKGELIRIT